MATKKTGLGRGLDALLGATPAPMAAPRAKIGTSTPIATGSGKDQLRNLAVEMLQRGAYQPRKDIRKEALQELADSIRVEGVIQPIIVRPIEGADVPGAPRFEIIAGERRWRAAQMAGLDTIPAIVRSIPDSAAIAIALIENIQRENLHPLEEAQALKRLIEEFEMTHQRAAEAIGRSRASVSNLLRLLELGPEARALVESRELEMGHARALLGLVDTRMQAEAARQVVAKGMSVRDTERLVRSMLQKSKSTTAVPSRGLDADTRRLQDALGEKLGAKVQLQHNSKGQGKLIISYNSLDELEGILDHIK
jgi:ParB family chromosome partitioning protein